MYLASDSITSLACELHEASCDIEEFLDDGHLTLLVKLSVELS